LKHRRALTPFFESFNLLKRSERSDSSNALAKTKEKEKKGKKNVEDERSDNESMVEVRVTLKLT